MITSEAQYLWTLDVESKRRRRKGRRRKWRRKGRRKGEGGGRVGGQEGGGRERREGGWRGGEITPPPNTNALQPPTHQNKYLTRYGQEVLEECECTIIPFVLRCPTTTPPPGFVCKICSESNTTSITRT